MQKETRDVSSAKKDGRGGARPGAGRKKNSGAFGEGTVPMRIPVSAKDAVSKLLDDMKERARTDKETSSKISVAAIPDVRKGLVPSLGQDGCGGKPVDLAGLLVKKPESSFFVIVGKAGNLPSGMEEGDYALVDRSAKAVKGCVMATMDGAGCVSFSTMGPKAPENLWGVVRGVVRMF